MIKEKDRIDRIVVFGTKSVAGGRSYIGTSMELPNNHDYSNPNYWDKRFSSEERYEWLGGFSYFKNEILFHLNQFSKANAILQLGCGNSDLSKDIREQGWRNITNIDISLNGLKRLQEREPESSYVLMDMTRMPFKDQSYDIVIEKATIDSLLVTARSPWELDSEEHNLVRRVLREVKRVLRPGGIFISITFSQPHFRVPLLCEDGLGWSVHVDTVQGTGLLSYLVVCEAGDPRPALLQYSRPSTLTIQPNQHWESSDEERFLDNLHLQDEEDEEEESSPSRSSCSNSCTSAASCTSSSCTSAASCTSSSCTAAASCSNSFTPSSCTSAVSCSSNSCTYSSCPSAASCSNTYSTQCNS